MAAYVPDSDAAKAAATAGGAKASLGQGFQNEDDESEEDDGDEGPGADGGRCVAANGGDIDSCGHGSGSREDLGDMDELREEGRLPPG